MDNQFWAPIKLGQLGIAAPSTAVVALMTVGLAVTIGAAGAGFTVAAERQSQNTQPFETSAPTHEPTTTATQARAVMPPSLTRQAPVDTPATALFDSIKPPAATTTSTTPATTHRHPHFQQQQPRTWQQPAVQRKTKPQRRTVVVQVSGKKPTVAPPKANPGVSSPYPTAAPVAVAVPIATATHPSDNDVIAQPPASVSPTLTTKPTVAPTSTPKPTPTTPTVSPAPTAIVSPKPTAIQTTTPVPTATPTVRPVPTAKPTATKSPQPTATKPVPPTPTKPVVVPKPTPKPTLTQKPPGTEGETDGSLPWYLWFVASSNGDEQP